MAAKVKEAVVYYPIRYGQKNVEIIDTPGLSDDEEIDKMTLSILPRVDLAIFILMVESPLSISEQNYLKKSLLNQDLGRVIFVINGVDRFRHSKDANRVVKLVKHRLQNQLLAGVEQEYGQDSPEYQAYLSRIGQLKVFSVSSLQALQAKLEDDSDLLGKSRFPELELALERLLIEERGIILLQVGINRALTVAENIFAAIDNSNLELRKERIELRKQHENALSEIEGKTNSKQEKIDRIYKLDSLQINELVHLEKELVQIKEEFFELKQLHAQIPKIQAEFVLHQSFVDNKQRELDRILQETRKIFEDSRILSEQLMQISGVFCHHCGKMNQPKAKFCIGCGTQLVCPQCGRSSLSNSDRCHYCGQSMSQKIIK
jgi:hypothetical protein